MNDFPPSPPAYRQEYQPAQPERRDAGAPQWRSAPAVYALIGVNVLVFLLGALSGGLDGPSQAGILWAPGVWQGQWWRLLTAMFLHGGFLHIGVNMWALYALGVELEKIYGAPRFLLLYFGAGWTGSLASLMFTGASVGASGAIFGLAGAWLAIALHRRLYFKMFGSQVLFVILINLGIGFSASGLIDNNGHIGGLIGGFALGLVLPNRLPEFQAAWRRVATAAILIAIFAATTPAISFSRQHLAARFMAPTSTPHE